MTHTWCRCHTHVRVCVCLSLSPPWSDGFSAVCKNGRERCRVSGQLDALSAQRPPLLLSLSPLSTSPASFLSYWLVLNSSESVCLCVCVCVMWVIQIEQLCVPTNRSKRGCKSSCGFPATPAPTDFAIHKHQPPIQKTNMQNSASLIIFHCLFSFSVLIFTSVIYHLQWSDETCKCMYCRCTISDRLKCLHCNRKSGRFEIISTSFVCLVPLRQVSPFGGHVTDRHIQLLLLGKDKKLQNSITS